MTTSRWDELAGAVADTAVLVDGVRADQWDGPTPCPDWTVRQLVAHLSFGHRVFAHGLLGGTDPAAAPRGDATADPATEYRASAAEMLAAFASPGALERTVTIPIGTVPGALALHLRVVEALVHGWDLARATGQASRGDQGLAEREIAFSQTMLAQLPSGRQPFGPSRPVAPDASAVERLAALLGREVGARDPGAGGAARC